MASRILPVGAKGATQITGYACSGSRWITFGRGFDSPRLHPHHFQREPEKSGNRLAGRKPLPPWQHTYHASLSTSRTDQGVLPEASCAPAYASSYFVLCAAEALRALMRRIRRCRGRSVWTTKSSRDNADAPMVISRS